MGRKHFYLGRGIDWWRFDKSWGKWARGIYFISEGMDLAVDLLNIHVLMLKIVYLVVRKETFSSWWFRPRIFKLFYPLKIVLYICMLNQIY